MSLSFLNNDFRQLLTQNNLFNNTNSSHRFTKHFLQYTKQLWKSYHICCACFTRSLFFFLLLKHKLLLGLFLFYHYLFKIVTNYNHFQIKLFQYWQTNWHYFQRAKKQVRCSILHSILPTTHTSRTNYLCCIFKLSLFTANTMC